MFERKIQKVGDGSLGIQADGDVKVSVKYNGISFLCSGSKAREKISLLQRQIVEWNGKWDTDICRLKDRLVDFIEYQHSISPEQFYPSALLLGYLLIKMEAPMSHRFSSLWGYIEYVAEVSNIWSPAAHYILGKRYQIEAAGNPSMKTYFLSKGIRNFSRVPDNDISLPSEILLPGVRSEAVPEMFQSFKDSIDPSVRRIPVPNRYRAASALALAQTFMRERNYQKYNQYIQVAERECAKSMNKGSHLNQIETNIELVKASILALRCVEGKVGRQVVKERYEKLIERIKTIRNEIYIQKYNEWIAYSWAGLASIAGTDDERGIALEKLRTFVFRVLNQNGGRTSFFKTDPLYYLAHKKPTELADFIRFLDRFKLKKFS